MLDADAAQQQGPALGQAVRIVSDADANSRHGVDCSEEAANRTTPTHQRRRCTRLGGGFAHHRLGVLKEFRQRGHGVGGARVLAQRQSGVTADIGIGIAQRLDQTRHGAGAHLGQGGGRHGSSLDIVFAQRFDEGRNGTGGGRPNLAEGGGGVAAHHRAGVAQRLNQAVGGQARLRPHVAQGHDGAAADGLVFVLQGLDERGDGHPRLGADFAESEGGHAAHVGDGIFQRFDERGQGAAQRGPSEASTVAACNRLCPSRSFRRSIHRDKSGSSPERVVATTRPSLDGAEDPAG